MLAEFMHTRQDSSPIYSSSGCLQTLKKITVRIHTITHPTEIIGQTPWIPRSAFGHEVCPGAECCFGFVFGLFLESCGMS